MWLNNFLKIVAPVDARVYPIEGQSDEIILYSLQSELNDYEIVLAHVEPSQEVTSANKGFFAGYFCNRFA